MVPRPRILGFILLAVAVIALAAGALVGINRPGTFAFLLPWLSGGASEPIICVYFYPWYSEDGRHWGKQGDKAWGVMDKPVIGYYDSRDSGVLDWQMHLMREAGIDCLFVSWWGPGSFEDKTARLVFEAASQHGLKAAIMIEPYLGGDPGAYDPYWWRTVLEYIKVNFVERYPAVYLKIDGEPLILAFNPIGEVYKPDTPSFKVRIVGNGVGEGHIWKDWDLWPDYDIQMTGELRVRVDGYVSLTPRIDRTPLGDNESRAWDPELILGWYERQWSWVLRHKGEVRIVAIYSWNEYHERSAIEPHWDAAGRLHPYYLYDLTAEFIRKVKG